VSVIGFVFGETALEVNMLVVVVTSGSAIEVTGMLSNY
jgi:hypothetical protein